MRLQLTALALAALGARAYAEPEGEHATVAARTAAYVDDDHTVISTSTVAVRGKPTAHTVIAGRYVADAVSSASVDVISAATERWTELRSEVLGGVAYADGTTTASVDYIYSHEHDWDSHTVSAGASRDVFRHNLTLAAGASFVDNRVGRADDANFHERMRVLGGTLRAVWVGGPKDVFTASYDGSRARGYQASPYRYAYVADVMGGAPLAFPEVAPGERWRHALTMRWNHHLLRDTAVRSHARAYGDDWGVRSLTAGSEVVVGLEPWELAVQGRVYAQQGATFYQDVYDRPRMYMTADRELSTFQDLFVGVRAGWIGETLALDASVTGFAFRFPEFARLPRRTGFIAMLGLVWAL
ncbi:MAG TPA: DUF3570 domain-containing protein [Kofleriaceae bacterium]|nr:DUF3570 domain-containing protein [Kofleriaceae bacterium]